LKKFIKKTQSRINLQWLLLNLVLYSQSGICQSPGGIGGGNLKGWFDAGVGITLTGGFVSAWTDRSAIGNASQATAAERPLQTASSINYNTAITFDGVNDNLDLADRMAAGSTGVSAYAVARQTATSGDTWGSVFNGQANGPLWTGGGYGLVALNVGSTVHGFYVRDYNTKGVSFPLTNGAPTLISGTWNGTTASKVEAFKNGSTAGTVAYAPGTVGDNGSTWIGSGDGINTDWCFFGDIAEIAVYNTGLSTANNNLVMSYLSLKYGITMSINYLNSISTTVYAPTTTYVNNIIGISRDDASGLMQKQSKNFDDTVRIYLSALAASNSANAGVFASDLSNVVVGADLGKMCANASTTAEVPVGISTRINREWKVTNTDFNGTFSMDFKLNACAVPASVNVADLRLIVDDDGNFAAGTTSTYTNGVGGLVISYSNPVITISGISNAMIPIGATNYITIGSVNNSTTPLPVELVSFSGEAKENHVDLIWTTATERNSSHFEIERSSDASVFEKINTVSSKAVNGNSNVVLSYNTTDNSPIENISYYRLKQVDQDQTFKYSGIISVNYIKSKNIKFIVYPNPNKGEFTADISGLENNHEVIISLKDEKGHIVYNSSFFIQDQNSKLNIVPETKLANGIYICTLTLEGIEYNVKVVVN
jgi:hypothetical protein